MALVVASVVSSLALRTQVREAPAPVRMREKIGKAAAEICLRVVRADCDWCRKGLSSVSGPVLGPPCRSPPPPQAVNRRAQYQTAEGGGERARAIRPSPNRHAGPEAARGVAERAGAGPGGDAADEGDVGDADEAEHVGEVLRVMVQRAAHDRACRRAVPALQRGAKISAVVRASACQDCIGNPSVERVRAVRGERRGARGLGRLPPDDETTYTFLFGSRPSGPAAV